MKKFEIRFEGEWFFSYTYDANSKEEALEKALQDVEREAFPFDLVIFKQYVNDEKIDRPIETVEWSLPCPSSTH
ncbi:MAG: hypothetical protein IIA63_01475 [Nitrospinae bacterium]|nr:hypothetical protein [Nitrospinota bacterium]